MTCEQTTDQVYDYLDGELDKSAEAEWEQHISACESCQALVTAERETAQLVRTVMKGQTDGLRLPADFADTVFAAASEPAISRFPSPGLRLAIAAAFVAVLGIGALILDQAAGVSDGGEQAGVYTNMFASTNLALITNVTDVIPASQLMPVGR